MKATLTVEARVAPIYVVPAGSEVECMRTDGMGNVMIHFQDHDYWVKEHDLANLHRAHHARNGKLYDGFAEVKWFGDWTFSNGNLAVVYMDNKAKPEYWHVDENINTLMDYYRDHVGRVPDMVFVTPLSSIKLVD